MIVLVTGGRDYPNRAAVFAKLDELHAETPITKIVHGACNVKNYPAKLRGTDRWAEEWALTREIPYAGYPAKWNTGGRERAEGHIRNAEMLRREAIDLVVGFPGGSGTDGMCALAKKAQIPVTRVTE